MIGITCGVNTVPTREELTNIINHYHNGLYITEDYGNMLDNVNVHCDVCGNDCKRRVTDLVKGAGCMTCAKEWKITNQEEFVKAVTLVHPNYEILSEYKGQRKKVRCRCKECGTTWEATARTLVSWSKGCPGCKDSNQIVSKKEFLSRLEEVNPDVELIGEYHRMYTKGSFNRIKFKCLKCGETFFAAPDHVLHGLNCPNCSNNTISRGEQRIAEVLTDLGIRYQMQKKFINLRHKKRLKFDFYLTDFNLCIEYQGGQHYWPVDYFGGEEHFEESVNRDAIKAKYCLENDILLHQIIYTKQSYKEIRDDILDFLDTYYSPPQMEKWRCEDAG